jgi:putative transcriptional regulator
LAARLQEKCSAVRQSIFYCEGEALFSMAVSYKRLWKLLIDRDMKKKDLCAQAGISSASITKMGKNGHVTTEILLKICTALDCRIEDIMEIVPDDKENT